MAMPVTTVSTPYGYRSEVVASLSPAEAKTWFEEIKRVVGAKRSYCQMIDLRKANTHPPDTKAVIQEIMQWNKAHGLQRSAVIVASATLKMQIGRMTRETASENHERVFDGSTSDWEAKALAWVDRGVDPDKP
jgi:hypothetical protein